MIFLLSLYKTKPKLILNLCYFGIVLLFCSACSTGLKVNKAQYKPIDKSFFCKFVNETYKTSDENTTSTILHLFHILNVNSDTVKVSCNNTGLVIIEYYDSLSIYKNKIRKVVFQGSMSRKGYCEIYLTKKKVDIPPLFPIIYSNHNINRIRIGLTISNDLIIDNMIDVGGNIAIFIASGYKTRKQYFFKNSN